ncbi:MAG: hypothetical protein KBC53_01585 [Nitrosomonas sp.]|nr:hypothetical protein [Nitrosomonas sp.]
MNVLHEFSVGGGTGYNPFNSTLLRNGNTLYGTTFQGGSQSYGVLFSIQADGSDYTKIYEWGGITGSGPNGDLILNGSTFYGVTRLGGASGKGVIYKLNTDGTGYTLLHQFTGGVNDGMQPFSGLTLSGSVLYGVTNRGGDSNLGTIYSINTDGTGFTLLHEFGGGSGDGSLPYSGVVYDSGVLYGSTYFGGGDDYGVIYSINANGTGFDVLQELNGDDQGAFPYGGLTLLSGTLYGTTLEAGLGTGVLFKIDTDGSDFSAVHNFNDAEDNGRYPLGKLQIENGIVYGMTREGGDNTYGILYSMNIDGSDMTTLHHFERDADDGGTPFSGVLKIDEELFGVTNAGGDDNLGTIFSYSLVVPDVTAPSLSLSALSPDPHTDNTPTLSGSTTDTESTISTVEFQMDGTGGSWTACIAGDGTFDELSETYSCTSSSLTDGAHTMYVRSSDSVANTSGNSTDPFIIDTVAPSISLSTVSPDPTTDTTPTISGTASDDYSVISSVEYQVDSTSGSWVACSSSDGAFDETSEAFTCTSSTLSQGSHALYVRSTDALSNSTDSNNYAIDSFEIDLDGPSITLNAVSPDPTVDTKPTITGTATDGALIVDYVQFQMDSTSGTWSDCLATDGAFDELSESFTCNVTVALTQAAHTVYVRSSDSSDNISQTSDEFTVDRTPSFLSADYPNEGLYIRQERPTFKFRASSGSVSQFESYSLDVRHSDNTGFTISGIPVDSPRVSTSRYTITSSGFDDGEDDNDYIYITSKSSSDWDDNAHDGRLKEGGNTWIMTAYESNGNSISTGHTFVVDSTRPKLEDVSTPTLGLIDNYLLSTQTQPNISFTFSDNIAPDRFTVEIYKQNYFLAIETGRTLVLSESISPTLLEDQLSVGISYQTKSSLPYGKYLFVLTGYDKAGNNSEISSLSLQLLSRSAAELLLKKPIKVTEPFSLPELEKKAILRREREARSLEEFIRDIKKSTDQIDSRLLTVASNVYQPIRTIAIIAQTSILEFVSNLDSTVSQVAQYIGIPPYIKTHTQPFEERIITLRKNDHSTLTNRQQPPNLSTEIIKEKIRQEHAPTNLRIQEIFSAASTTVHSLGEPVNNVQDFASRVSNGAQTFYAIVFDIEPTVISNVTIEDIQADSVTVTWETNHPATGKVNYGPTLSFGEEIHLAKYEKTHKAELKGLTPGKKYFFEVMSHGKNYTYDSFYTVETLIEERE